MRKWAWRVELLSVSAASGWAAWDWFLGRYVGPAVFVGLMSVRLCQLYRQDGSILFPSSIRAAEQRRSRE